MSCCSASKVSNAFCSQTKNTACACPKLCQCPEGQCSFSECADDKTKCICPSAVCKYEGECACSHCSA